MENDLLKEEMTAEPLAKCKTLRPKKPRPSILTALAKDGRFKNMGRNMWVVR